MQIMNIVPRRSSNAINWLMILIHPNIEYFEQPENADKNKKNTEIELNNINIITVEYISAIAKGYNNERMA